MLPASSLASGLARSLGLGVGMELLSKGYAVSDAYPVAKIEDVYVPSIPSTVTTYRIKSLAGVRQTKSLPRAIFCLGAGNSILDIYRWVYVFVEKELGFKPSGLLKEHGVGKPVAPLLDREISTHAPCIHAEPVSAEASYSYDSAAINPSRGSVETEMLFTYYALPPGTCFWFTAALPVDRGTDVETEIRVGGRLTAGYGRAIAAMRRVGRDKLAVLSDKGQSSRLYLWSPLPSIVLSGLSRSGWSATLGIPRLAVTFKPAGSLVSAPLRGSAVETRFRGLLPPYGQAEAVHSSDPVPQSFQAFTSIVKALCGRLESLEQRG